GLSLCRRRVPEPLAGRACRADAVIEQSRASAAGVGSADSSVRATAATARARLGSGSRADELWSAPSDDCLARQHGGMHRPPAAPVDFRPRTHSSGAARRLERAGVWIGAGFDLVL